MQEDIIKSGLPFVLAALLVPFAAVAQQASRQDVARYCTNCATVLSVTVDGEAAGQVGGSGSGRTASGAAARGHKFVLVLRYTDGRRESMVFDNDPGFRTGDKVRVRDGVLSREP